jgi:hypothetical protein
MPSLCLLLGPWLQTFSPVGEGKARETHWDLAAEEQENAIILSARAEGLETYRSLTA